MIELIIIVLVSWFLSAVIRVVHANYFAKPTPAKAPVITIEEETEEDYTASKLVRKLNYQINAAQEDMDAQAYKVERLSAVLERVELERDACVPGSSNYMKFERKAITLENQIRTAIRKINKDKFDIEEAQYKMREVA